MPRSVSRPLLPTTTDIASSKVNETVASISDLKALSIAGFDDGDAVRVLNYYDDSAGGGGIFYWDADDTSTDNGGTIIKPTYSGFGGTGRWKRSFDILGTPEMFGAKGNGVADDTSELQGCLDTFKNTVANNDYLVSSLTVSNSISGHGKIIISSDSGDAITMGESSSIRCVEIEYTGQSSSQRNIIYVNNEDINIDSVTIRVTNTTLDNKANAIEIEDVDWFRIGDCDIRGPYYSSPSYLSDGNIGWGVVVRNSTGIITESEISGWLDAVKCTLSDVGSVNKVTVSGCFLNNNARDGVDGYSSKDGYLIVKGNHFTGNQDLVADFKTEGDLDSEDEGPYSVIFEGNQCYDNNFDRAGLVFAGNNLVKIHNNTFFNQSFGVSVLRGAAHVSSNTIKGTRLYGIQVKDTDDVRTKVDDNIVIDSNINGGGSSSDRGGITIDNTSNATFINNKLIIDQSATMLAIRFENAPTKNIIKGNETNRAGVLISGLSDYTTNYVFDNINVSQDEEASVRWDNESSRQQIFDGNNWGKLLDENNDFWEYSGTLSDDEFVKITDLDAQGFGKAIIGDNEEYGEFRFNADGTTINLIQNTSNFSSGNNDTDFVIYVASGELRLRNRLGSSKEVKSIVWLKK